MPATINLRTIPGSIERGDRYDAKTLGLFGPSLGQDSATVAIGVWGATERKTYVRAGG